MSYIIDKNTPILIYGAATEGHLLLGRIQKHLKNICGFIDKRAREIHSINGYPVYSLDSDEIKNIVMKSDPVIIIAVKNVFEHRQIAYNLKQKINAVKLVLIPLEIEDKQNGNLERVYNDFFYKDIRFPYVLEEVNVDYMYPFKREDYRIEEKSGVVIPIPVSRVFTNIGKTIWSDINIAAYFPHIRLFQYYAGEISGKIEAYLNFCIEAATNLDVKTTEHWKDNVIENRRRVYDEMRMNYELDHKFFIEHCANGKLNAKKHYFNLTAGKHRAAFLTSIGCAFIPVMISYEDEEKWLQKDEAKKLYDNIEKNKKDFYMPRTIDNPYFFKRYGRYRVFDNSLFVSAVTIVAEILHQKFASIDFRKVLLIYKERINEYLIDNMILLGCSRNDQSSSDQNITFDVCRRPEKNADIALCEMFDEAEFSIIKAFMLPDGRNCHKYYLVKNRKFNMS